MRLIDADHLEKWIQSRWLGNGGKPTDAPTIYEIVDQIDREDTVSYESDKDMNVPSTDCISRQAAIDEIEIGITYAKVINIETGEATELFNASNAELKKAIDRIKALPTAQPTQTNTPNTLETLAVFYLDMFTKTYCRDKSVTDDLAFRCGDCDFLAKGNICDICLVKLMARKLCPDYRDFGSMGDL